MVPARWSLGADFTTEFMFALLYFPTMWAKYCNNEIYQAIGLIYQTAQAHNVTLDGGLNINITPGEFAIDKSPLSRISARAPGVLSSYSSAAIAGADNFNDGGVTINDVFDLIVENTRQVTPTCEFFVVPSVHFTDPSQIKSAPSGPLGTREQTDPEDAF